MIVSRFFIIGRSQRQSGKGEIIVQDQNRDGLYELKTQWKTHYGQCCSDIGFKTCQSVLSATSISSRIGKGIDRKVKINVIAQDNERLFP